MGRSVKRLLYAAILFMGSSAVFLGLLQNASFEEEHPQMRRESVEGILGHIGKRKKPRHANKESPWGHNFHDDVAHLHARDLADIVPPSPMAEPPDVFDRARRQHVLNATQKSQRPTLPDIPGGAPSYLKHPGYTRIWPIWNETEDRIVNQMNHIPKHHEEDTKVILVFNGVPAGTPKGRRKFEKDDCPVRNCRLSYDRREADDAHAILFQNGVAKLTNPRPPDQIWILFILESPFHVRSFSDIPDQVNWTATYRLDSTINTPYERFVPFANITEMPPPSKNYAANKTRQVAWFVSNCAAANGRSNYAKELQNYLSVDIYGACGDLRCDRSRSGECFKMLSAKYKFYLAFENSNCVDYITEKFYWNGLYNDIIPIVMGARPEDYAKVAPPHSYIHVDDFESPRHLAKYLKKLDRHDELYNEYFRWKGTGQFINTKFWCRLCSLVHEAHEQKEQTPGMWYGDIEKWWHGPGVCLEAPRSSLQRQNASAMPGNHTTAVPRNRTKTWLSWRDQERTSILSSKDILRFG